MRKQAVSTFVRAVTGQLLSEPLNQLWQLSGIQWPVAAHVPLNRTERARTAGPPNREPVVVALIDFLIIYVERDLPQRLWRARDGGVWQAARFAVCRRRRRAPSCGNHQYGIT